MERWERELWEKAKLTKLAFADGIIPSEIHIVPMGSFEHEMFGSVTIVEADIDNMIKNFDNDKNDLVIDFEHQSLSGDEAPAAGWIKALKKKEDGIWATDIEFTDKAKGFIGNKEYRYISPVINFNALDKVTGHGIGAKLHSIALTNTPWFDGMKAVAAKQDGQNLTILGYYKNNENNKQEEKMIAKIRKLFDFSESLSEEDVIKELQIIHDAHKNGDDEFKGVFKEIGLEDDSKPEELLAKIKEFKEKVDDLQAKNTQLMSGKTDLEKEVKTSSEMITTLVAKDKERDAEKKVDDAISSGKILPKDKDHYMKFAVKDVALFDSTVAVMPKIVEYDQVLKQTAKDNLEDGAIREYTDKVAAKRKENSKLTERDAQILVGKEDPELTKRYVEESRNA